jgi:hypothetical protein
MGLARKLLIAAENPMMVAHYAWARSHVPSVLSAYRRRARAAGLMRLEFILSFDCDTEDDIAAAGEVHRRLVDLGIIASYAVPGELLRQGSDTYRRIAESGAEFLNHGDRRHMYFDPATSRHESCFFYDEEPRAAVEADIVGGDLAVTEVIGTRPAGFRTPHFGTFQRESELRFLHSVLRRLGYVYSTSTTPGFGLCYGPVFSRYGLPEIPVSGRGSDPFTILDSWSCFARPDRVLGPDDYAREAIALAEALADGPGLINYYADPSHVAGQPMFFEAMAQLVRRAAPTTFGKIAAMIG